MLALLLISLAAFALIPALLLIQGNRRAQRSMRLAARVYAESARW